MKIAIPVAQGRLAMHFGHCEKFAVITVDTDDKTIHATADATPPPHEPGVLPRWLHNDQGVQIVIAGGMGRRAQSLFEENDIDVIVGAPSATPEEIVQQFLAGRLELGANACEH